MTFARLQRALAAGARGIAIVSAEEDRVIEGLEALGDRMRWPVHTWSARQGIDADGRPIGLSDLLTRLHGERDDALWVLLDAIAEIGQPAQRRSLRELAQRTQGPAVVLVHAPSDDDPLHVLDIPELLVEVLPPPDLATLTRHVEWIADVLASSGHDDALARLGSAAPAIARAALGLGLRDLDRLVAEAVWSHGTDPDAVTAHLRREKPPRLDRAGLLETAEPAPADELGGLSALKAWLGTRALALRPEAEIAAIPPPRGVLLLGVQGCGKSLAARVCAGMLGLPLVRLDPGRIFGGTVGESEANLRRVIALLDRLAPIVLWLDEIDKGLAGIEGTASDAGTAARVVGSLLTWLQERTRPVFVAATANRVDVLPPELLRRGRLDEIFFVDLPDAEARAEILRVHLEIQPARRLGTAPPCRDPWPAFADVARAAEGFAGAEIESALVDARLAAFAAGRPIAAADLKDALARTIPLSRTRAESIDALRAWANGRARRA